MSIRGAVGSTDLAASQSLNGSRSLVDRHTTVDGSLETQHDLRVEGRVSGTLRCEGVLYVAAGAEVNADVTATDAIIEGLLEGSIACAGRLEIRPTGVVRAGVNTHRLVIHEGAVLEGRLDMAAPAEAAEEASGVTGALEPEASTIDSNQPSSYSYLRSFSSPSAASSAGEDDLPGSGENETEDDEPDDES